MAEIHRARRAWADELLAQRILFDAVWTFAWRALSRYGFSDADREDLAQDVVIAAYRGRTGYRGDRGNPEQWVSRIVRNKVHDFVSERRRSPVIVGVVGTGGADLPSGGLPGDESTSVREIAEIVFSVLPEDERQAVIDLAIEGYTLREVAARDGVSPSTVHERYQRGVAALRGAVDHGEDRAMFAALPAALAGSAEPLPEVLEQAWQRAIGELGPGLGVDRTRTHESEPPASGPRGRPGRLLLLLGPLAGLLAGGAIAVAVMRALPPSPARVERSSAPGAAPAVTAEPAVTGAPAAEVSVVTAGAAPARAVARSRYQDPFDPERALVDRGRAALITGDVPAALAALGEHARRFPDGQNSAVRERLWSMACAQAGDRDARCAARR